MSEQNLYTLITGASEGLGKAFALECAARGRHLILVALPDSGLHNLAHFILGNYKVDVICYELNLSFEWSCYELYDEVTRRGAGINMLINNAGIGNTQPFVQTEFALYKRQLDLNIRSVVLLTHLFVPLMQKQRSYILNISSLCTFFYLPQKQVYGATKSFIYFFSRSLRKELKSQNVVVSVLCPGGMNTNLQQFMSNKSLSAIARMSLLEPEKVARIAIRDLLRGKEKIIPGRLNRLFLLLDKIIFQSVKDMLIRKQVNRLAKSG